MRWKVRLLLVLILGSRSFAAGRTDLSSPLTLLQAQRLALLHNPDLRIARAQAEMALGQLRAVREFPNPVVGLAVGKINTDSRDNATAYGGGLWGRSYDSVFSLSQLVELGKRGVRRDSAAAAARAAAALRDDSRRLVLLTTGQLYCAALEAGEEMRVQGESAGTLREEAAIGAERLRAGDVAATDQAQLEIAAAQLDLNVASARTAYRAAVLALESLLGLPTPRGDTVLADTLDQVAVRVWPEQAEAAPQRPDLAAAEAGVEKSEADLRLERQARVPDLTLSLEYEHQPPDQPNSLGVGVSFPVPFWNRNRGAILSALAAREQAVAQLEKVQIQAAAELSGDRAALAEARGRLESYRGRLEPDSAAVVRAIEYAYRRGGASLVELLAAERSHNDIRVGGARARADAAAAALALAAALNRLDVPPEESTPN